MYNNLLAGGSVPGSAPIVNPIFATAGITDGVSFFSTFIPALITLAFVIATVIFLFMFIAGATHWISSGGDKQNLETAKSKVTSAIVGLVVLYSAWAVIGFVEYFFCVNITLFEPSVLVVQNGTVGAPAPCPAQPASSGSGGSGGVGTGGGGGTGNPLCGGCINGGCGITGNIYRGKTAGSVYICNSTGWQRNDALTINSTTCGTCN